MKVIVLCLNSDNFGYLVVNEHTNNAVIVDVSNQPDVVYAKVQELQLHVQYVLSTHKHWDHSGKFCYSMKCGIRLLQAKKSTFKYNAASNNDDNNRYNNLAFVSANL